MTNFITRKKALQILGIHYNTLYKLVKLEKIETLKIGRNNVYNVEKFLRNNNKTYMKEKINICYCRVSSKKQSEDLERQKKYMKEKYPTYQIIYDIGSSLNFKRKGLLKIINDAIDGKINEIVIAHKDRLARIGYELIEMIVNKYSNGKITILNKNKNETPTEEITKDIISIMNIYVAKINGFRKYRK